MLEEFIESRKEIQPAVLQALGKLLEKEQVDKVYLVGSYAGGYWVDKDSPEWFKDFRRSIGKTKEVSDVDFYTEPQVESTENYEIIPQPRGKMRLIYDNGKTII